MKKIALTFVAVFILFSVNAQIIKGSLLLLGNISSSNYKYEQVDSIDTYQNKQSSFAIAPGISYFVADNFAVGISMQYSSHNMVSEQLMSSNNTLYKYTSKRKSIEVSPFASYYFTISEKAYFSLSASFAYGMPLSQIEIEEITSGGSTDITERNNLKTYSLEASLWPGILFLLNNRFALYGRFGSVDYSYYYSTDNDISYTNYTRDEHSGFNFNMTSISFGVKYFLVRK